MGQVQPLGEGGGIDQIQNRFPLMSTARSRVAAPLQRTSRLGAEFVEASGVGLHEANQVLRFEDAERAEIGRAFGETILAVPTGNFARNHDRLRMPGVTLHGDRRRVVAGNGDDRWFGIEKRRQRRIGFLDRFHFGFKVPVFAGHVGAFDVNENEVVRFEGIDGGFNLLFHRGRAFHLFHPDELGQALVHWINCNRGCFQSVAFLERLDLGLMRDTAEQKSIRWLAVL